MPRLKDEKVESNVEASNARLVTHLRFAFIVRLVILPSYTYIRVYIDLLCEASDYSTFAVPSRR